ncbi:hypothetical protein ACJX0J_005594, partial [Zea mays]
DHQYPFATSRSGSWRAKSILRDVQAIGASLLSCFFIFFDHNKFGAFHLHNIGKLYILVTIGDQIHDNIGFDVMAWLSFFSIFPIWTDIGAINTIIVIAKEVNETTSSPSFSESL